MHAFAVTTLCALGALTLLPGEALAHGGIYPGPRDTTPPGGGRGGGRPGGPGDVGPTTPGPGGPAAPAPGGPVTPGGPTGPTTGGPGNPPKAQPGRSRGGIEFVDDLTTWTFWWERNKDQFLRLKQAVHEMGPTTGSDEIFVGATRRREARDLLRPTANEVQGLILPELKKTLDATENRDIATSCMVAMAKIGKDHADFRLVDVFAPRLRRHDQEVRETAALAIGLGGIGSERELDLLTGLALDRDVGRTACDGEVDFRTRSFALYGLGLTANATSSIATKRRAFEVFSAVLADRSVPQRDLAVAALSGLGLLALDPAEAAQAKLRDEVLTLLEAFYLEERGVGDQLVQAHCPTAIARLIGRDEDRAEHFRELFAADLAGKGKAKRAADDIARSCALALGQLVRPYTDKDAAKCADGRYSRLLLDSYEKARDRQTRYFAIMALGQIGGDENRAALLRAFDQGQKESEKPWCALALGVQCFRQYEADAKASRAPRIDGLVTKTLIDAFRDAKTPELTSSLGVALGLARATDAADDMRSRMLDVVAQEQVAGYLAIGLALMDDRRSIEDLRALLPKAVRRPQLLMQTAVALGKLGDKQAAYDLQAMLSSGETNLAKLSAVAAGLGFIGDQRTIAPLIRLMNDTNLGPLARAFAVAALGGVADKELLPWNAKLATDCNYRAAVETLTSNATGVLDIL